MTALCVVVVLFGSVATSTATLYDRNWNTWAPAEFVVSVAGVESLSSCSVACERAVSGDCLGLSLAGGACQLFANVRSTTTPMPDWVPVDYIRRGAPIERAVSCRVGWLRVRDSCYIRVYDGRIRHNWMGARDVCRSYSNCSDLIIVDDDEEADWLLHDQSRPNRGEHVGLRYIDGAFFNADGSPATVSMEVDLEHFTTGECIQTAGKKQARLVRCRCGYRLDGYVCEESLLCRE